jgi:hypothetical protein
MGLPNLTVECLACSGELHFVPGQLSTRCNICEDDRPLPLRFSKEVGDSPAQAGGTEDDELDGRTRWRCMGPGCGAVLSARERLVRCPTCGAEVFEDAKAAPVMRAHGVLGFLISENQARAALRDELARLRLSGSALRLTPVHLPAVVMSCEVAGEYRGERGTEYRSNNTTHVRWEAVEGSFERPFENRRASAAATPPDALLRRLEPWDWAFCAAYEPALLDAAAAHVTDDPAALFERRFPDQREALEQEAEFDIGGDHQRVHHVSAVFSERRLRVVMLPVWVGTVEPGATDFAINGRTGEIALQGHESAELDEHEVPLRPYGRFGDPKTWMMVGVIVFIVGGVLLSMWSS